MQRATCGDVRGARNRHFVCGWGVRVGLAVGVLALACCGHARAQAVLRYQDFEKAFGFKSNEIQRTLSIGDEGTL